LVAQRDAFTIERLRAGGAICLGKTNMPPMANGGMQLCCYGRAESPYNADYLTAPFASGSSNGAGTVGGTRSKRRGEGVGVVGAFGANIHDTLQSAIGHRRPFGPTQAQSANGLQTLDGGRHAVAPRPV
ncbi:amidase family protein, partial [Acinetobacter baumannii]|uniref:amidase family protein n=1 Tax=Acinetobacter baumannii TaxID=470 RepID=UPI0022440741